MIRALAAFNAVSLLTLTLLPTLALLPTSARAEEVYAKQVSCSSGPYKLTLPRGYRALRALAPLKREKVLESSESDGQTVEVRELRFAGLEVVVLTSTARPNQYVLASASVSSSKWRISGPLRVGSAGRTALKALPLREIPADAELELNGDDDSIVVTLGGGRVQSIDYQCHRE